MSTDPQNESDFVPENGKSHFGDHWTFFFGGEGGILIFSACGAKTHISDNSSDNSFSSKI